MNDELIRDGTEPDAKCKPALQSVEYSRVVRIHTSELVRVANHHKREVLKSLDHVNRRFVIGTSSGPQLCFEKFGWCTILYLIPNLSSEKHGTLTRVLQ